MSQIEFIIGPCDSGKSTRFLARYQEAGATDAGLFSQKRLDAVGRVSGYDVLLLPDMGTSYPLARLSAEAYLFAETDRLFQGRFVFSASVFAKVTTYIQDHPSPHVWIDEIGKLELQGLGYAPLLRYLLERDIDLTLTVRDQYLPMFLTVYSMANYRVV